MGGEKGKATEPRNRSKGAKSRPSVGCSKERASVKEIEESGHQKKPIGRIGGAWGELSRLKRGGIHPFKAAGSLK